MKEQTQSRLISGKVTLSVSWISCRNIVVACLNFFILKTPELNCRRTRLNVFCGIATFLKTPQIKVRSHVYDLMRGGRHGGGSFAMLGPFHSRVCGTVNNPPKKWKWPSSSSFRPRPQHISEASAPQHSPERPKKLEELILLCNCWAPNWRPPSAAAPRELNPLLLQTIWLHNLLQSHGKPKTCYRKSKLQQILQLP